MKIMSRIFSPKVHKSYRGTHYNAYLSIRGDGAAVCAPFIRRRLKRNPKKRFKLTLLTKKQKGIKCVPITLGFETVCEARYSHFIFTDYGNGSIFTDMETVLIQSKKLLKLIDQHVNKKFLNPQLVELKLYIAYEEVD